MARHNIAPLVGMEYLDEDSQLCKCLVNYDGFVIGEMLEHIRCHDYPVISQSKLELIKSITQPIELIDGNAYQFDYGEHKETYLGFYESNVNKDFNVGGTMYNSKLATNIKLLKVK